MIKIFVLHILVFLLFSSCVAKKLITTSDKSIRGDAVFSLIVPENNYGESENIHIYSWTQGGKLNVNRVLIDFNLDRIPKTAIIDSAFLSLYFNPTSSYNIKGGNKGNRGNDSIEIQRVISDWNEDEVTWGNQPETTIKNQTIIAKNSEPEGNYTNINITNLIQDIISNESGRYGIMVRHKNEVPYNVVYFASGEHPNKKIHPTLRVYYKLK